MRNWLTPSGLRIVNSGEWREINRDLDRDRYRAKRDLPNKHGWRRRWRQLSGISVQSSVGADLVLDNANGVKSNRESKEEGKMAEGDIILILIMVVILNENPWPMQ